MTILTTEVNKKPSQPLEKLANQTSQLAKKASQPLEIHGLEESERLNQTKTSQPEEKLANRLQPQGIDELLLSLTEKTLIKDITEKFGYSSQKISGAIRRLGLDTVETNQKINGKTITTTYVLPRPTEVTEAEREAFKRGVKRIRAYREGLGWTRTTVLKHLKAAWNVDDIKELTYRQWLALEQSLKTHYEIATADQELKLVAA